MSDLNDPLYESPFIPYQNFPVVIRTVSVEHAGSEAFYEHRHAQQELLLVTRGKLRVYIGDTCFEAAPGDLILVNNNELHRAVAQSSPSEYLYLILEWSFLKGCTNDDCQLKYFVPIEEHAIRFQNHIPGDREIQSYMLDIQKEYEQQRVGYEIAIKADVYRLYLILLRNYVAENSDIRLLRKQLYATRVLTPIFAYILEHFCQDIVVDDLCGIIHVSKYYFYHLFKTSTGKSPSKYISLLRINRAEELLRATGLSIAEIARQVGYPDGNYFSRIFKKEKGYSPNKVRAAADERAD